MDDLLVAFGLLLVIEGVLYTLFPDFAKRLCAEITRLPEATLRLVGLVPAIAGVGLVWFMRR